MPTYFIVNATITDPDVLSSYRAAATATFEGREVEVLVATNDAEVVEGTPAGSRVVVLRFPDERAFQGLVSVARLPGHHRDAPVEHARVRHPGRRSRLTAARSIAGHG